MGKKSAHSGESPKERSINKMDKFIASVMKKNNLTEAQLKRVGLNKGVLGEFGEGTIKLAKGLWQPADFYHENLHRLKAFAKASNNKGLAKLIERGEGLAKNTKEYVLKLDNAL